MSNENFTVKNFVILGFPGLDPSYYGLASAVMFLIYVCTLIGNGVFLILFTMEKSIRKPMYFIMFNLAVCDVLFSTTTLPKTISMYWFNDREISFMTCFTQMHFVHYFGSVNALILSVMAFDRYVAVCHPLRYATIVKDSTVLALCAVTWVVAEPFVLIPLVRAYAVPYCASNMIIQCYCDYVSITRLACTDSTPLVFISFILAMTVLLTPLAFILFSYGSIIVVVFQISSARGRLKTLSTCSTQLLIIALFFLPRCMNYIAVNFGIKLNKDVQILIVMIYSLLPPMINPLIYCFKTKEARECLKKVLDKLICQKY